MPMYCRDYEQAYKFIKKELTISVSPIKMSSKCLIHIIVNDIDSAFVSHNLDLILQGLTHVDRRNNLDPS